MYGHVVAVLHNEFQIYRIAEKNYRRIFPIQTNISLYILISQFVC